MARVVFCLRNLWYFRILTSCVQELLDRGHSVEINALRQEGVENEALGTSIAKLDAMRGASNGKLKVSQFTRSRDGWAVLDLVIARLIDFFHFRTGKFEGKSALISRAKGPPPLRGLLSHRIFQARTTARVCAPLLAWIERRSPSDPRMASYLARKQPDLVIFSPLIDLGLSQFQQLRTARRLGLRTALVVNSWDNLSSKAWLRETPDLITVWNETQVDEAVRFHGVSRERIRITGAPGFDSVFDFRPSETREAFLQRVGLPVDRPLIAYVASATLSPKKAPETEFVARWIASLRTADNALLRDASILVRPHPKRRDAWAGAGSALPAGSVIWPAVAENPADEASVSDYLHTLAHADAIVGLNTSAFLEGAILGRPVLTVLDGAYADSQAGTFHFEYLAGESGVLRVANSLAEHAPQLAAALTAPMQSDAERAFVARFLRPGGIDQSATKTLVNELESFLQSDGPQRAPKGDPLLMKAALWPFARYAGYRFKRDAQLRRSMKL